MTVIHALTPAPRRGAADDADLPNLPDVPDPDVSGSGVTRSGGPTEVLAAARILADAAHAAGPCHGASALATGPACARAVECERPGVITVVTEDDTTYLCGMHAMTAVFTTPGLLALVKPDGM